MKSWFISLLVFLLIPVLGVGQVREVDSLSRILNTVPDQEKINIYQSIITKLWLNHTDSAILYARDAVKLADRLDDPRSKSIAIRLLGGVHYYKGNYDSTIKCSHLAYTYSLAANDSSLMNTSLNNLGLAYYNVGSYPEALDYLLRALSMKIRIKQDYGLAQNMNNVGLVYNELKKYEQARDYFNRALKRAQQVKDKNQILYSFNNIGFTYLDENKPLEAKLQFEKAIQVGREVDNVNWNAVALSGMGQVYFQLDDYTVSRRYFLESLKERKRISDQSGISEIYYFIASMHLKSGRPDSARLYIHRSQSIAQDIGDKDQMIDNLELMKNVHVYLKRYDSALYYQSQYIATRDSVLDENLRRDITDVQLGIERQENRQLLADRDTRIKQITQQTYFLLGGLLIIGIISFFTYRLYQDQARLGRDLVKKNFEIEEQKYEITLGSEQLKKAQAIIHEKNLELEGINKHLQKTVNVRTEQLELANQQLRRVNLELENFIYRSSHDIRGPLVRLVGLSHVALLDIKDEKSREYFKMLYEAAQQLTEIFDRLKIVSQINDMDVLNVPIDMEAIVRIVKDRLKIMEGFDQIEISEDIDQLEWQSDPMLLEMIFQNLLENAVRFQKKGSTEKQFIHIRVKEVIPNIEITVIDNGIGIKDDHVQHIYQMFSKAARDHQNMGLGLYIVKQAVEKLNGSVSLKENENQHTEFEVRIPLSHQSVPVFN
jgi:signal transduction histidine kinase/Tfp pilus assembly protein PilF